MVFKIRGSYDTLLSWQKASVPSSLDKKKPEKDANFCLIKDGIFFPPFFTNSALVSVLALHGWRTAENEPNNQKQQEQHHSHKDGIG
jgi:hypothetical protein